MNKIEEFARKIISNTNNNNLLWKRSPIQLGTVLYTIITEGSILVLFDIDNKHNFDIYMTDTVHGNSRKVTSILKFFITSAEMIELLHDITLSAQNQILREELNKKESDSSMDFIDIANKVLQF